MRALQYNRRFAVMEVLVFVYLTTMGAPAQTPSPEPLTGPDLARTLCSSMPLQGSHITGAIKVRLKKQRVEVPVVCDVVCKAGSWESIYQTAPTNLLPVEHLVIVHFTNAPNQYFYSSAISSNTLPAPRPIAATNAARIPFAGSDFSIADLGLDFLHWPGQKRLGDETHLNQSCYVLESSDDGQPEIVRVRTCIDQESASQGIAGVLIAEAFDRNDQKVKYFSLGTSSFKKVNGQYQLKKMEISNEKTGSTTILNFNLDP
jgi:hypothetical protein